MSVSSETEGRVSFSAQKGWNRTKNSRQRRLVREDLPLRAPRRGCGKSEQYLQGMSGPDIGTIASLRQPPPAAPAKDGFGRLHAQPILRC